MNARGLFTGTRVREHWVRLFHLNQPTKLTIEKEEMWKINVHRGQNVLFYRPVHFFPQNELNERPHHTFCGLSFFLVFLAFTLFLFCSHAFSVLWKALFSCRYFLPSMRTCPQGPHFMSIFIIWMDKWVRRNESVYAYMACMCVYTYMCERAWLHACIACLLCVCLQFKYILRISINQTMTWGLIKDHKGLTIRATGGNASP